LGNLASIGEEQRRCAIVRRGPVEVETHRLSSGDDARYAVSFLFVGATSSLSVPKFNERYPMDYRTVNLAINLAGRALDPGGESECNPGGSTICWSPTKGCGSGGMTCVGTSSKLEMLEVMVSLPPNELERFQQELGTLVSKYTKK